MHFLDSNQTPETAEFLSRIYEISITSPEAISMEKREDFINEDPATKSKLRNSEAIENILKSTGVFTETTVNLSDDVMNLINVAAARDGVMLGFLLLNKHCYLRDPFDKLLVKRTVEINQ
jgi:hypothetical protein